LSNETGLPMLELECAELFGGLVGESEKLMKKALDIIKANAPCIILVDEIEKALAGVGGSGANDGGTTKRSMAQLLKFLGSDKEREGVYVIATCNDISSLPPEWVRPGRWDAAPFFIDLPNSDEQEEIMKFYQKKYSVNSKPDMTGWSGAEIECCCRIAAMMKTDTGEAAKFIVPVSRTMRAEIEGLRKWAEDRTIKATVLTETKPAAAKRTINL
jgi:SpoVK/Ycf46/Vps4 family AAA+-type ATPase